MLCLTRKPGQKIVIGDDVFITLLSAYNGLIRVGIDAPTHVSIHREEVYKKIQREFGDYLNENY